MLNRTTSTGTLNINTVSEDSVVEVGDSEQTMPVSYTIAVQREKAIFIQDEFDFNDYAIFSRPFPEPVVNESIRVERYNETPCITVHRADVFILSSSSIVHFGSCQTLKAQSRIKHIRHLLRERPQSV